MPRSSSTAPVRMAYRYSPGDGHTYTWDGSADTATVWRHRHHAPFTEALGVPLGMDATGDTVSMIGCARTAEAFMITVDAWRQGRPVMVPEDGS